MLRKTLICFVMLLAPVPCLARSSLAVRASSGDTAWLLAATVLVLLTALPGMALFFGGRMRTRSVQPAMLQLGAAVAIASLVWIIVGYTLALTEGPSPWLGALHARMLAGLEPVRVGTRIPESAYALFSMTLAMVAAGLMTGAWAERSRVAWAAAFCGLWSLFVFVPITHWIWGGGWLRALGVIDFAGGLLVCTSAGVSALAVSLLLRHRLDSPKAARQAHSPGLSAAGAFLAWVGWMALIGGSALAANDDAGRAMINAQASACSSALVWLLIERVRTGRSGLGGFASGALAGLAAITPAAGYISTDAAILFGIVAAFASYGTIRVVRGRLLIDDTMNVYALFGVGGMTGTLLVAVFISPLLGGTGWPGGSALVIRLGAQVIGIAVIAGYSAGMSILLALAVSRLARTRSEGERRQGETARDAPARPAEQQDRRA